MKCSTRTMLGVGLFIPLAIILLATFACLPVPVGDPEQSKVDDKLTGAWVSSDADHKELVILRPWDAKTWYMQYLELDTAKDKVTVMNYKAWVTTLGGATFITCETLDNKDFLAPGSDQDKYYFVARLDAKDNGMSVRPLKDDGDDSPFKDLKTREKVEEVIKARVNDDKIYAEPKVFTKLTKDQLDGIDELRKKANVGLGSIK